MNKKNAGRRAELPYRVPGAPGVLVFVLFLLAPPAWSASLSVSPSSGAGGVAATLGATGFDSGNVGYNTGFYVDNGFVGRCPDDARANCSIQVQMPSASGSHEVRASNSAGESDTQTYTVAVPTVRFFPACGPPGAQVTVTGDEWTVGLDAGIYFNNGSVLSGNYPDTSGHFNSTITVPPLADGTYIIMVTNSAGFAVGQTFDVGGTCAPVGEVKQVWGSGMQVQHPGGTTWTPVVPGDPVRKSDTLRSQGNGGGMAQFQDGTSVGVSGDATYRADNYHYDAGTNQGNFIFRAIQGTFFYLSGLLAKDPAQPPAIDVPVGSIGIRGTGFTSRFDPATQTQELYLGHGTIDVTPAGTGVPLTFNAPVTIVMNATGVTTPQLPDADGDGVPDDLDNCVNVANPAQLDADGDGYGNACDADLDNNGTVTATDFALLRGVLGQAATASALAAAADLDGNGTVTATDFAILRKALGSAPGPSALRP